MKAKWLISNGVQWGPIENWLLIGSNERYWCVDVPYDSLAHRKMNEFGQNTQKRWFLKTWAFTKYRIPLRIRWRRLGPIVIHKYSLVSNELSWSESVCVIALQLVSVSQSMVSFMSVNKTWGFLSIYREHFKCLYLNHVILNSNITVW